MTRIERALVSLFGGALVIAGGAGTSVAQTPTQPVDVVAPQPAPKTPGFELERTMPLEQRGIRDGQYYPGYEVKSEHDPAFVLPFAKTIPTSPTSGVRVGLSAWTAPALPYDIPQETGGVAVGLTFIWSVPIEEKGAPVPAPGGRR